MKPRSKPGPVPFQLKILSYSNSYYIDAIERLEAALARAPCLLQIDLIGVGEIPADAALIIRSVLMARAPGTRVITRARSSLHGASVLVWLMGDHRIIRDDARVYFRHTNLPPPADEQEPAKYEEPEYSESPTGLDPEEGDYARVLQVINEFLPIQELAGRLIEVPVLRQFGLVDNDQVDHFLATAFGGISEPAEDLTNAPDKQHLRGDGKVPQSRPIKK